MTSNGRPSSLAAGGRELLLLALEVGHSDGVACAIAGIDAPAYERWLERGGSEEHGEYYQFSLDVELAKGRTLEHMETTLLRHIASGHWPTLRWYLERRFPEIWGPDASDDFDFSIDVDPKQPRVRDADPTIAGQFRGAALEPLPLTAGSRAGAPASNEAAARGVKLVWTTEAALEFARAVGQMHAQIDSKQRMLDRADGDAGRGRPTDEAQLTAEIQGGCERMLELVQTAAETYG